MIGKENKIGIEEFLKPWIKQNIIIAYKLVRKLKNEEVHSLFINKKENILIGKWLKAECFPTNGYAIRPFWHSVSKPIAPHLSMKNREWWEVEIRDYQIFDRPKKQGTIWYLSEYIKFVRPMEVSTK